MKEYDDHHIIDSNITEKNDIWLFTVRPGDGEEHGPLQTSPDTTIMNTPPTCSPDSPVNGTIFFSDKVLLTWNGTDADNDSLTYNVYLDNDEGTNLVVSDLDHNYWEVSDLVSGIYYWRVEAFDGENTSKWMSAPLSFSVNVTSEDIIPLVRLDSPENNSIINDTSAEFRWTAIGDLANFFTYDVYFGTEITPPLIEGNFTSSNYSVEELEDGETYYWTIIPKLGDQEGTCIGGIHTFEVRKGFIPVYDVRLSLERESIRIIKGAVASVDLEIENLGNVHETINISISGGLKDRIVFTPQFYLGPDETETATIKIITNDRMEPGSHILTIKASFHGGETRTELVVVIIEEEGPPIERSSGPAWLWWFIGAVILVAVLVIIFISIRTGKKKRKDDAEEVFADIEHVPSSGMGSEMPAARMISQRSEPPSMAGSIQYGYIRREPMIRGPLETLPGMQPAEDHLPGIGFKGYQPQTASYADMLPDMETASAPIEIDGVSPPEQTQQFDIAGQFPPDAIPGQPLLPENAGQGTEEPDAVERSEE